MQLETRNAGVARRGTGLIMNWKEIPDRVLHNHAGWDRYPGITAIGEKAGREASNSQGPIASGKGMYTYIVYDVNMELLFSGTTFEIVAKFPEVNRSKIFQKVLDKGLYKKKYYFRKDITPNKGSSNRAGEKRGKNTGEKNGKER